jgi:aspartyl-tRNA(Asn)/glutamyl-tRNA(Gln) amidotransferase subunit C
MISKQEVEHIAKLARLELSENEIKKMQKDLSKILDYFDLLKKAPKIAKEKIIQADNKHLRKDEAKHSQLSDKIIGLAPDKKDGLIKVKTIL